MLRAGPLSSPEVMETLGRDYVNAWVLAKTLPRIAEQPGSPHVRLLAGLAYKNFLSPVDIQIYTPTGALIDHVCANAVLATDANKAYLEILRAPWRAEAATAGPRGEAEDPR